MQHRFLNYKEDDSTFLLNSRLIGLVEPGCYRGWDFLAAHDSLMLALSHTATGIQYVDSSAAVGAWRGVLITKQGTVIMEDETVELEIAPGDVFPRIDLVVCNHKHALITGGRAAYYTVVRGMAAATPVAPPLSNPGTQTVIGQLYVPANAGNLAATGVKWTQNRPEFANKTPYQLPESVAHWNRKQAWGQQQKFQAVALEYGTDEGLRRLTGEGAPAADGAIVEITSAQGVVFKVNGGGTVSKLLTPAGRRQEIFYLRFTSETVVTRGTYGENGAIDIADNTVMHGNDVLLAMVSDNGWVQVLGLYHTDPARLNRPNRFSKVQQLAVGAARFVNFAQPETQPDQPAGIQLGDGGNTFEVSVPSGLQARIGYLTAMPEGTEITLIANRSGRRTNQAPSVDGLPDWCFEDLTAGGLGSRLGYQPIKLPSAAPIVGGFLGTGRLRVVPQSAGGAFKFLSFAGKWLLISMSDTLPVHLHDRKLLKVDPITGGSGYVMVPVGNSTSWVLHEYSVPYGAKRDYMFHHSMWVAMITTFPELSVSFYRNDVKQREFGFVVIRQPGHSQIITTSFLFEGCEPGEVLQVRIDRRDKTTNQISLNQSTLSLDGTPSAVS